MPWMMTMMVWVIGSKIVDCVLVNAEYHHPHHPHYWRHQNCYRRYHYSSDASRPCLFSSSHTDPYVPSSGCAGRYRCNSGSFYSESSVLDTPCAQNMMHTARGNYYLHLHRRRCVCDAVWYYRGCQRCRCSTCPWRKWSARIASSIDSSL